MKCQFCGQELPENAKFCFRCKRQIVCMNCSERLLEGASMCVFCGNEISTLNNNGQNYIKYYYCPIKILQSHKIRADFICEVSPFSLDFSRQTIKSNYGQKYTF